MPGTMLGILEFGLSLGVKESDLQRPAFGEYFDDGCWLLGGIGGDENVVLVVSGEAADYQEADELAPCCHNAEASQRKLVNDVL